MAQQLHLIGRQQRLGHQLQEDGFEERDPERQRHQQSLAVYHAQHDLHQLLEAIDGGSAQFIGLALRVRIVQRGDDRRRCVAHEHRLEQGAPAADQGQRGQKPRHFGEAVEELILGPEQQRRPHDGGGGEGLAHALFTLGLALGIVRIRLQVGADGRDMHHGAQAQPRRFARDRFGAFHMHGLKGLAALEQDAGEVDHGVAARHGVGDLIGIGHVALDEADLAHLAHGAQEEGAVGTAGGDLDAPALLGQRPHHIAPQETGAAEDRDLSCFHGTPESV